MARVAHIGRIAAGLLSEGPDASVMGITSRGVFLNLISGWVIFLSYERYRGPLTLNLPAGHDVSQVLENGLPVKVAADEVVFPTIGYRFCLSQAEIWQAPPLPYAALPGEQRRNRLVEVLGELSLKHKTGVWGELFPHLLGNGREPIAPPDGICTLLTGIREALQGRSTGTIVDTLRAVLGLGAGLTPTGDDLVAGLMLALNRWGYVLASDLDMVALNQEVRTLASCKTTLLSANLIECACQGQADERLILALDGIMAGKYDPVGKYDPAGEYYPGGEYNPAMCAASLTSWGNTSGIDTLVGMALAIAVS